MQGVIFFVSFTAFFQYSLTQNIVFAAENLDYTKQGEWGGFCNNGTHQQSPIDIKKTKAKTDITKGLIFENIELGRSVLATNQAPSVKYSIYPTQRTMVSGGRLNGSYVLDSFHFHWPGEHTIDGRYFDLEGHFVFYSSQYSNITAAYGDENGLTVVGVFYNVGGIIGSYSLDALASATSEIARTVGAQVVTLPIFLAELIPDGDSAFFTYKGSLTTPDCNEIVNWNVFRDPLTVSKWEYEKLTNIYYSNGNRVEFNNRDLQPLKGRTVYYKTRSNSIL